MAVIEVFDSDDDEEQEETVPINSGGKKEAPKAETSPKTRQRVFGGGEKATVSPREVASSAGSQKDSDDEDSDDAVTEAPARAKAGEKDAGGENREEAGADVDDQDEDSVKVVQDILGFVSRARAIAALKDNGGDPVEAIMALEAEEERRACDVVGEGGKVRRERVEVTIGTEEDEASFVPFPGRHGTASTPSAPVADPTNTAVPQRAPEAPLVGLAKKDATTAKAPPTTAEASASVPRGQHQQAAPTVKERCEPWAARPQADGGTAATPAPPPSKLPPSLPGKVEVPQHGPSSTNAPASSQSPGAMCGMVTQQQGPKAPSAPEGAFANKTAMFKSMDAAVKSGKDQPLLECLSRIQPSHLPKLLGAGLEEPDLLRLFRAASAASSLSSSTSGRIAAFRLLQGVAVVPRANLTTSMLDKKDKQQVEDILASLEPRQGDEYSADEWQAAKELFLKWP